MYCVIYITTVTSTIKGLNISIKLLIKKNQKQKKIILLLKGDHKNGVVIHLL